MVENCLKNIVREVDAIRGYLIDPVPNANELLQDEVAHILTLCNLILSAVGKNDEVKEAIEELEE